MQKMRNLNILEAFQKLQSRNTQATKLFERSILCLLQGPKYIPKIKTQNSY